MAGFFEKFKHKPAPTPQFRGMQQKWQDGDVFYKVDSSPLNAEGLCETIASAILAKSNIADYCIYTPQLLITNDMQIPGCATYCSHDMSRGSSQIEVGKHCHTFLPRINTHYAYHI